MFGVDLWEYGRQLTRMNELQRVSSMKSACIALDMQVTFLNMLTWKLTLPPVGDDANECSQNCYEWNNVRAVHQFSILYTKFCIPHSPSAFTIQRLPFTGYPCWQRRMLALNDYSVSPAVGS